MPFPAVPVEQPAQAEQGQAAAPTVSVIDVQNDNGVQSKQNRQNGDNGSSLSPQMALPYSSSRPVRFSRPPLSPRSPRPPQTSRPVHRVRRVVQAIFLLALILFLVMISQLTYAHFFHNSVPSSGATAMVRLSLRCRKEQLRPVPRNCKVRGRYYLRCPCQRQTIPLCTFRCQDNHLSI